MTIWIDAQISPFIALWINNNYPQFEALSLRALGLRDATDQEIFLEAREQNVILMSKDYDFVKLLRLHGSPPQLIWITCGNTSNAMMSLILSNTLPQAISLLETGEIMVEIHK